MSSVRLALLEVINTDRYSIYRSENFPWYQALVRAKGDVAQRFFLGLDYHPIVALEDRFIFGVEGADADKLIQSLVSFAPTHVILNERLAAPLWKEIRESLPNTSFEMMDEAGQKAMLIPDWLGITLPEGTVPAILDDVIVPDYSGEPVNDLAKTIRPFLPLLVGPPCAHMLPLASNSFFGSIDFSDFKSPWGCSFCSGHRALEFLHKRDPVELALEQIHSAARTANPEVNDLAFLVRGTNLLPRLHRLFSRLREETQSAPNPGSQATLPAELRPVELFLSNRLDELLAAAPLLEQALTLAQQDGHKVHLWNMGIENLSEVENHRFNKGLSLATIREGVRVLFDLQARFPRAFHFDGFGFILYTPWTTFEDLRTNVRLFRELGLPHGEHALGTVLQLLPGRAITRLAEADGLTCGQFGDWPADSGCVTSWDAKEIPWKFRDPRVGLVCSVTRRIMQRRTIPQGEAAMQRVQAFLAKLPIAIRDPMSLAERLLDVAELLPAAATMEDLLVAVEENVASGVLDMTASELLHASPESTPVLRPIWKPLAARLRERLPRGPVPLSAPKGAVGKSSLGFPTVEYMEIEGVPSITIRVVIDGIPLDVCLEPSTRGQRAFLSKEHVGVSYRSKEATIGPQYARIMRALLDLAEQILTEAPSQGRHP